MGWMGNQVGHHNGRFILNKPILLSLFLMLVSDSANKDRIDKSLFSDHLYFTIKGVKHTVYSFVGDRDRMLRAFGVQAHGHG